MGTITTHSFEVDGLAYKTSTFPATEGLVLGARLAKVLAGPLVNLLDIDFEEGAEGAAGEDGEGSGEWNAGEWFLTQITSGALDVPALLKEIDPEDLADLAQALLARTECSNIAGSGSPGPCGMHFGAHFAGRYGHLFDVLVKVARLGFRGP